MDVFTAFNYQVNYGILLLQSNELEECLPKTNKVSVYTRFEPSLVVIGSTVWSGREAKNTKKKELKVSQNSPFSQPPSCCHTSTKFCMQGWIPDIFFGFAFQKDRLKMWEL